MNVGEIERYQGGKGDKAESVIEDYRLHNDLISKGDLEYLIRIRQSLEEERQLCYPWRRKV